MDNLPRVLLLGYPFFEKTGAVLDARGGTFTITDFKETLPLRADPCGVLPFSLLLLRVGFFLISLHQCYSLRTFAHLKEHS